MPIKMNRLTFISLLTLFVSLLTVILSTSPAVAFCGFYVGKADTQLFNHASQVVYVRNGNRTVLSIMNDYEGEPSQFALVVPVPVVLAKDQIHIGDRELFTHLDEYSSPRLVEYYDPDPCARAEPRLMPKSMAAVQMGASLALSSERAKSLGVTIEAEYSVGEYDIEILSATQSGGLETYLLESGYHVPLGVSRALSPYVRQAMKFFVAKVNLKEHRRSGLSYLRPIQFAFESPKFMLPIRLGMINAQGPQDLIIYMLTHDGRVETTNYQTVKLPTGFSLPEYIQSDFSDFYKAMFSRQVEQYEMRTVFTEYVWDMGTFCDPCAAAPLSSDELRQLGVFWLEPPALSPGTLSPAGIPYEGEGPGQVIITRLHLRYSAATFPEDLMFQETGDRENFQARYVLRHAWAGSPDTCPEARSYFEQLRSRRETEAATLADLTGWKLDQIYDKIGFAPADLPKATNWWQHLWQ
jgi:hypothetical protein